MDRIRVCISLDSETAERLKQIAFENHRTVSSQITEWAWETKVKNEQLRGQQKLAGKGKEN